MVYGRLFFISLACGIGLATVAIASETLRQPAEKPMLTISGKKYNVLLALKRDGEYMPVRDKGPLFIVYPYDSAPELKSQKFYSRSAWQVARLEVK